MFFVAVFLVAILSGATAWAPILVATIGVLIGPIVGERMPMGLSPRRFGQTIGVAISALGIWMLMMPV